MRRIAPHARHMAPLTFLCAVLALGFVATTDSVAGDKKGGKSAKKDEKPHLDFKRTYADALLEARIRNLPIFVSRHKDF